MKALTPEEYDKLAPTRPYTDKPLGGTTAPLRSRDAKRSKLVAGHERSRRRVPDRVKIRSPWTGQDYWVLR